MKLQFRETLEADHEDTRFLILVFDVLENGGPVDGEYRYILPEWTFDMRAAEFELDDVDEALEMVLGEAALLMDPPGTPRDTGPRFGQPNVPLSELRQAHKARCQAARDRHAIDVAACRKGIGKRLQSSPERVARFRDELKRSPFAQAGGRV